MAHADSILGGTRTRAHSFRLEEVNDKRQGMIQRLKISEKEKDALEGRKTEAEQFLTQQVGALKALTP